MKYRKIFGENLSKHRKQQGLSQEKFAEKCNIHRTYIGAVERGERNIGIDNIEKISKALGVEVTKLLKE